MVDSVQELKQALNITGDAMVDKSDGSVRLVGSNCNSCGAWTFPPTSVCPKCMSESLERQELSEIGSLYSWSVVRIAPKNWKTPFIAGYVDFPEKVRIFAHMVDIDPARLSFDMKLRVCKAVVGQDADGTQIESYSFVPVVERN